MIRNISTNTCRFGFNPSAACNKQPSVPEDVQLGVGLSRDIQNVIILPRQRPTRPPMSSQKWARQRLLMVAVRCCVLLAVVKYHYL